MRTDYILYVIAVICFIVAGLTAAHPYTSNPSNALIAIVLAIIGVIFVGGGYSLRPQTHIAKRVEPTIPQTKPAMEEQPTPPPSTAEVAPKPEPGPAAEPMPPTEAIEETKKEETAPPEVPAETSQTKTETKKPARKRREKKEVKEA
jgi:outer membrane biosynthesis protein TonB